MKLNPWIVSASALLLASCAPLASNPTAVLEVLPTRVNEIYPYNTGPYLWQNAQIEGGGYVPGVEFSKAEKGLVYARTDIGGAYRYDPSSKRWLQLLSWVSQKDWNLSGVDSMVADPNDANRVYALAGTYTNNWTNQNGAVLSSNDKGDTWHIATLPFKVGGNMPGRGIGERLSIDPNNSKVLYLGARSGNGLWKSTDYGKTWAKVESFKAEGAYVAVAGDAYQGDKIGVGWITFDPSSLKDGISQTIYVGSADVNGSIHKSTDGGATWQTLPGQPTGFIPHHGILSEGVLYISYSNQEGPYNGNKGDVYAYDTAKGTWTNISPVPSSDEKNIFGYGGLAIDAQNPNVIMVSALNLWWPDTQIFRSTDKGKTWTQSWDWGKYPERTSRVSMDASNSPWLDFGVKNPQAPSPAVRIGWMVGDLDIDPFNSNRMFYGTGATLYGSENLTNWDNIKTGETARFSPVTIKPMAAGIEEVAVRDLISPPTGAHLHSAVGDIAGFRHDDLTAVMPQMAVLPNAGTQHSLDYAGLKPEVLIRVGDARPAGSNADLSPAIAYSKDSGLTWTTIAANPTALQGSGNAALSADASSLVWAPSGDKVWLSKDWGVSWAEVQGLPNKGTEVISDKRNPKRFFAVAAGVVYTSNDGGASFSPVAAKGLEGKLDQVRIETVFDVADELWLAATTPADAKEPGIKGLYRSTDAGASFSKVASVDAASVVGFGKAAEGQKHAAVYISGTVGGVDGLFRSDDGISFVRINDDAHQFASTNQTIAGDPRVYGRVYVGTNGYGIIYGDIRKPVVPTIQ